MSTAAETKREYHAYWGEKPYIFVSYAHADKSRVMAVVAELIDHKYRVWYDEGIEVGADWPEMIAGRLAGASHVIAFTSRDFADSPNCIREINFAVDQRKQFSRAQLDDTELEGGMGMQLSVAPTVDAREASAYAICRKLEDLGSITGEFVGDGVEGYTAREQKVEKRINKWMLLSAVFALLFAAAATAALGLTQGWFSGAGVKMDTVSYSEDSGKSESSFSYTSWNDPVSRDLLLSSMNNTSLYICGNAFVSAADGIDYREGAWRLGDYEVKRGDYSDFSALAEKDNVTELAMVYQELHSLATVNQLPDLVYLDISGNDIRDLSPLKNLKQLKVLRIMHMPTVDMSTLTELENLQRVYISLDMLDMAQEYLHADFDIVIKE